MKIVCFSVAAMDYFSGQDKHFAGGNSLNQAVRFRNMGFESAFIGPLGTDKAGDKIARLLEAEQVDTSHMYRLSGETASNEIINDEEGERFGVEGAWKSGVYDSFELSRADWDFMKNFHIWSTHANGPNYPEALARKQDNQFMSVDFLHLTDYELLEKSLAKIDIAYFGGTPDMEDELTRISGKNPGIIVLTLGSLGSIAFEGGKKYKQEAFPLDKVIDTTGCGDAFQAGFTAEYVKSKDIRAALRAGALLGKKAAQSFGGVPWK